MRISNNMMIYNFLSSLNKSQNRMNSIQEQLADGRLVHRPSDDPIRAIRSLKFNVNLTMNEQFTQNAKDAAQWMNQTDSALAELGEMAQSAKELLVRSASTNPAISHQALGSELDGLINRAVTIGNSQIGDRYIFAGQQDKVVGGPLERTTINVGGILKDVVVYKGDLNKISMPVQAGAADPKRDSINVTAEEVFGPLTTVTDTAGVSYRVLTKFNELIDTKNMLSNGTVSVTTPSGGAASVSGIYTGAAQAFQVRIGAGGVNALGQVTAADYSIDGGTTWVAAATVAGTPSSVTLLNGISLNIATRTTNAVGDTYSFQAVPTTNVTADTNWLSNTGLALVDKGHDRILLAQTQIGARMASYEMVQNMMERDNTTITENAATNDYVDIAKATVDFKNIENVYRTALAVGARIMPPSLADFLR